MLAGMLLGRMRKTSPVSHQTMQQMEQYMPPARNFRFEDKSQSQVPENCKVSGQLRRPYTLHADTNESQSRASSNSEHKTCEKQTRSPDTRIGLRERARPHGNQQNSRSRHVHSGRKKPTNPLYQLVLIIRRILRAIWSPIAKALLS